jgi:hypothetical protein
VATLREYEQAKRRADPSLRMAARLAAVLGARLEDFVAALDDDTPDSAAGQVEAQTPPAADTTAPSGQKGRGRKGKGGGV